MIRLGIGAAIRGSPPTVGLIALVERVIFAMAANRVSPSPLSKLAGAAWRQRGWLSTGSDAFGAACYRAMDFFLDALPELQKEVCFARACSSLEVDLLFFDGSSTHGERDGEDDGLLDDEDEDHDGRAGQPGRRAACGYGLE